VNKIKITVVAVDYIIYIYCIYNIILYYIILDVVNIYTSGTVYF